MTKTNDVLTYEDYVQGIDKLEPEQQLSLVELLSAALEKELRKKTGRHKLTELDGLGTEIWSKVETEKYIRKERDSWD